MVDKTKIYTPSLFVAAIANYFTCSNAGDVVENWQELLLDGGEDADGVEEEHRVWTNVGKGILAICFQEQLPMTLETADMLWVRPGGNLGKRDAKFLQDRGF
jgi:hypothetical protein